MRQLLLTISLFVSGTFNSHAHSGTEAFFRITSEQDRLVVRASFPWTLRNALLVFDPQLEQATTSAAFEASFKAYIKTHLRLFDQQGTPLKFLGFQRVEDEGHQHQETYQLFFSGGHLQEIHNTLLCNISERQVNHHRLVTGSKEQIFTTGKDQPSFRYQEPPSTPWPYLLVLALPVYLWIKYGSNRVITGLKRLERGS